MTDSKRFSAEPWLDAQRKFWDAWMDMTRQAGTAATAKQAAENPWADALDQWWKAVAPMTSGSAPLLQDFFDKLVGMGKSYFSMAEHVATAPGADDKTPGDAVSDWLDRVREACNAWGASLSAQQDPQLRDEVDIDQAARPVLEWVLVVELGPHPPAHVEDLFA